MRSFAFTLLITLFVTSWVHAQSYITDSGHVEFTSSVPLHTFTGTSDHLNGLIDFDKNLVDFYIDLQTIKTGNGKRDRDMYSTLEVDTYPFAEFTGELQTRFALDSFEEQDVNVRGEFSIHGVTRTIDVQGTLQKDEGELHLEASWILNMADYNIEPPGILFYRVDEEIEIKINAELKEQNEENNET